MSSNLPPGVTESMIPGNRPIDAEFDKALDRRDCLCCEWYDKCELQDNSKMTCGLWKLVEDAAEFDERFYAQQEYREDDYIPEPEIDDRACCQRCGTPMEDGDYDDNHGVCDDCLAGEEEL